MDSCLLCNNAELYVKKSFPHWLGMSVLVVACILSVITYARHWIITTWAILIGSAVLDGILYLFMGNATVCYRCRAETRGVPVNPAHEPFDLAVGERYRQERLRRQQLRES